MVNRTKFRLWYFLKICGTKILFLKSYRENAEREWEKDMASLTNSAHVHKMELTSTPFSFDAFHFLSSLQFKLKKLTHPYSPDARNSKRSSEPRRPRHNLAGEDATAKSPHAMNKPKKKKKELFPKPTNEENRIPKSRDELHSGGRLTTLGRAVRISFLRCADRGRGSRPTSELFRGPGEATGDARIG